MTLCERKQQSGLIPGSNQHELSKPQGRQVWEFLPQELRNIVYELPEGGKIIGRKAFLIAALSGNGRLGESVLLTTLTQKMYGEISEKTLNDTQNNLATIRRRFAYIPGISFHAYNDDISLSQFTSYYLSGKTPEISQALMQSAHKTFQQIEKIGKLKEANPEQDEQKQEQAIPKPAAELSSSLLTDIGKIADLNLNTYLLLKKIGRISTPFMGFVSIDLEMLEFLLDEEARYRFAEEIVLEKFPMFKGNDEPEAVELFITMLQCASMFGRYFKGETIPKVKKPISTYNELNAALDTTFDVFSEYDKQCQEQYNQPLTFGKLLRFIRDEGLKSKQSSSLAATR